MKKILFFVYPHFADFEIAHTLFLLRKLGNSEIVTVSIDGKAVESLGGLFVQAKYALNEIEVDAFDLVLVSGGDGVDQLIDNSAVVKMFTSAHQYHIPIAAMCASALLMAKAGVLDDKKFTCLPHTYRNHKSLFKNSIYTGNDVAISESIITAKGTAFAEFAVSVCKLIGLLSDDKQYSSMLNFCKGITERS
ncbi:thiamine biosynthesis protein ThiJ [Sporolactobacillus shoreae]|uniref:Thiamine biosynthesis protein ThiJ n=1 Tax=Sporolactobacillus shoreae TaxID=1465501 RepID=A0A4Z0GNS7_9BACL|nr:DJ-1/PfpI family protein [Sporolactobacillus shoreae]TGA97628.1 thiamine biosynthesis protein ThiJ [Sporolactobacillus shoreae]